jgi:hypothetical protein
MDLRTMIVRLTVSELTVSTVTDGTANVIVTVIRRILTVPGQSYREYITGTVTGTVGTVTMTEAVMTGIQLRLELSVLGRTAVTVTVTTVAVIIVAFPGPTETGTRGSMAAMTVTGVSEAAMNIAVLTVATTMDIYSSRACSW